MKQNKKFQMAAVMLAAALGSGFVPQLVTAESVTAVQEASTSVGLQPFDEARQLDATGVVDSLAQVSPNLYIAGQPDEKALQRIKKLGVTSVVNLRTETEMADRKVVPFDEASLLGGMQVSYIQIPAGGPDAPFSPAMVDQFAEAAASGETILLHCGSGFRAAHLWAAYLVRHQGLSVAQATQLGRKLNFWRMPMEGFLGESLVVVPAEKNSEQPQ